MTCEYGDQGVTWTEFIESMESWIWETDEWETDGRMNGVRHEIDVVIKPELYSASLLELKNDFD